MVPVCEKYVDLLRAFVELRRLGWDELAALELAGLKVIGEPL